MTSASESGSLAFEFGQGARSVHDSAVEIGRETAQGAEEASQWISGQFSEAGESLSAFARKTGNGIDLFLYDIRLGYEDQE